MRAQGLAIQHKRTHSNDFALSRLVIPTTGDLSQLKSHGNTLSRKLSSTLETASEESLVQYITQRAQDVGSKVIVFNSRLFQKRRSSAASNTINAVAAAFVGKAIFWPRPVYVRRWKFPLLLAALKTWARKTSFRLEHLPQLTNFSLMRLAALWLDYQ